MKIETLIYYTLQSEWRDGYGIENGGVYVPSHVIVVVRAVPLEIADAVPADVVQAFKTTRKAGA